LPREVARRNYIFDTIKSVFRKYGFQEIETPAIERLETLTGKYGDEGDKLLFKILNSGDYLKDVPADKLQQADSKELLPAISEKGLRYDLTVPLARYVVMHQEELPMPFKRFHIGPVWRADRPQKGRYQEFYQCDADVIGSNSLLNEVELTKIYLDAFEKLGIDVTVQINNRKILFGIAAYFGHESRFSEFVAIMDKLDKVGVGYSGVVEEFKKQNFNLNAGIVETLDENGLSHFKEGLEQNSKDWETLFTRLNEKFSEQYCSVPIAQQGSNDLHAILKFFHFNSNLKYNPYLTRGLDYYTGTIWEVKANGVHIGSLGGGGRYDNLTEMFGGQNMSGVGISFGIERIYDVMEELGLFPETIETGVKVLFVPRDASMEEFTFQQTQALRDAGVAAEIFLGNVKKQKQFKYADDKNIPYIIEVGENERQAGKFRLRNTTTRETTDNLSLEKIVDLLNNVID